MNTNFSYKENAAFKYFEEICKIPHGSGNEKAIADYIVDFANKRGLYVYRDEFNSVLVRKCAAKGYENKPSILLQGHTDMVCEKNEDTEFDFTKDALRLREKDGYLYAEGTTLGADDGVAVALMLAFLDDETLEAPELECLFTSGEETALVGATHFDYSYIKSHRMINMDTEYEGEAVAGSAGGVRCRISIKPEYKSENKGKTLKLTIGGLKGGHSGADIHLGRMSAMALGARLLKLVRDKIDLVSFLGGNMDNAIARECEMTVRSDDEEALRNTVKDFAASLSPKAVFDDRGYRIGIGDANTDAKTFSDDFKERLISFVNELPHGVCAMSRDLEGLVESSSNFASVKNTDDEIKVTVSMRSSVEASLEAMKEKLAMTAEKYGFDIVFEGQYPGWQFDPTSKMADRFKECYKKLTGKEGRVVAIHAGLECGLIKSHIKDMDIVSIGPTMHDIHTPNERLNIQSFLDFEKLVREIIKE